MVDAEGAVSVRAVRCRWADFVVAPRGFRRQPRTRGLRGIVLLFLVSMLLDPIIDALDGAPTVFSVACSLTIGYALLLTVTQANRDPISRPVPGLHAGDPDRMCSSKPISLFSSDQRCRPQDHLQ